MGDILDRLVQLGIGEGISKTRDEMIKEDEIYNSDIRDMEELESRYEQLNLLKEEKRIIDDYIACKETISMRAEDISYVAGMKDAFLLLNHMGLIKTEVE